MYYFFTETHVEWTGIYYATTHENWKKNTSRLHGRDFAGVDEILQDILLEAVTNYYNGLIITNVTSTIHVKVEKINEPWAQLKLYVATNLPIKV